MGINVGFTGSRDGMTVAQQHMFRRHIQGYADTYDVVYFHHGAGKDRLGRDDSADMQAARIAKKLGCVIVPHPPENETAEALLARNRIVVARAQEMFAAPRGYKEEVQSGTWMTVRHARARSRDGRICWPCGCMDPLETREHPVD